MLKKVTDLPLTNSIILLPFLGYYEESGYSTIELLRECAFTPSMINPECYIPSYHLCKIINNVSLKTQTQDIGITAAKMSGYPSIHPTIAVNIPKAESFLDLFLFLSSHRKLQGSHFKLWIEHRNDTFHICHQGLIPYHSKNPEQTEYFRTLTLINVLKSFMGYDWKPETISLVSPKSPPHALIKMTKLLKVFNNNAYGCIPIKAKIDDIAEKIAIGQIMMPTNSASFERFIAATETFIEHQNLSLPFLSEIFGCSQRSLQRILQIEGTNFQKVLNYLKFKHAIKLLNNSEDVNNISMKLGYSDPSNFTRAFKKYTGISPSLFRELNSSNKMNNISINEMTLKNRLN